MESVKQWFVDTFAFALTNPLKALTIAGAGFGVALVLRLIGLVVF
jgi:hypothetical protein